MPVAVFYKKISLDEPQHIFIDLDEVRNELFDDKLNLLGLAPPKLLDYFNISEKERPFPIGTEATPFSVELSLSRKIIVQQRIVYDIFMLFGDVGGLYDFVKLGLASIFGFFSTRLLTADLVQQLYRGA